MEEKKKVDDIPEVIEKAKGQRSALEKWNEVKQMRQVGREGSVKGGAEGARGRTRIERQLMMGDRKVVGDDTQLSRIDEDQVKEKVTLCDQIVLVTSIK